VSATTIVATVWERASSAPTQLAVIENERGRWLPMTARLLADRSAALGLALARRGVAPGSRVANLVGNRTAWLETDLAVQAIGGISAAVPASEDDEALAELLQPLGAAVAIVEDALAVQRLQGLVDAGRLDPIGLVVPVVPAEEGIAGYGDLVAEGETLLDGDPAGFERLLAERSPDDPATITYTAGAGGRPRPVTHTAAAAHAAAVQVAEARRLVPSDVTVVSLDPAHPFERSVTIYPALVSGAVLAYPEDTATIERATLEVQPTFLHLPVERLAQATEALNVRLRRNRGVKRLVARWWERSTAAAVGAGQPPSGLSRRVVGRPALRTLGWNELRSLLVTGVAVPGRLADTLAALGLTVESGYGVVEAGGLVAIGRAGGERPMVPLQGTSIVERDGVLVASGPGLASSTDGSATVDAGAEAGVTTGDLGRVDQDGVTVVGPAGSAMVLPDGRQVVAADVERRLRESPFVGLALVESREGVEGADGGVFAAIEIDQPTVREWAAERGLPFTTFASLVALDEVKAVVADEVARLAPEVDHHELVPRPLQAGRDITRIRTTVYTRPPSPASFEEASTLEQRSPTKESLT
jgi:long-chain acyl-CoA synthetase